MDAQWLMLLVLKATLLLVAGMLAAIALRSAAARHLVWLATLVGVLVLPWILPLAPLRLEVLPARLGTRAAAAVVTRGLDGAVVANVSRAPAAAPLPMAEPVAASPSPARFRWPAPLPALIALWAVVALALLGRLALASRAARRIVRAARPADDPRWTALLHDLADRLDLPEAPALVVSDRVEMPFACGPWRSTIVLPAHAARWGDERRQVVLLHELAHLRRRDLLGQQLGRLACAAYWFHPLVWSASRRLRAESERACDDLVLACGARASDYAGHLLDILTAARGAGTPATVLPMARAKEFEGRLIAILDPGRKRRGPGRGQAAGLLAALAAIFLVVAAAAPSSPPSATASASPSVGVAEPAPVASAPAPPPEPRERPHASVRPHRDEPAESGREQSGPEAEDDAPVAAPPSSEAERDRRGLLVRALRSDPDAGVRRSAAWALGESVRDGESAILVAALRGDADARVREMAAWALARDRGDEVSFALAQALRKDASDEVKATAAWALGQRRRADSAALVAAVADPAVEVRTAAIWALGNQRLEAAPPDLVAALRDEQPRVRVLVAWALTEINDPASVPPLRTAFAKEQDPEARRAIFRALAFLGDRTPEVLDRAAAAKDPELRSRAVLMLGGLGPGIWPWPWPWPRPRPMP